MFDGRSVIRVTINGLILCRSGDATLRKFNEDMSDFGAGVFLKEMLAGKQMRAFGVGPDFMPSRTHNVGRESVSYTHLTLPTKA